MNVSRSTTEFDSSSGPVTPSGVAPRYESQVK